ncbi:MAG: oxygenase MpaB family protein [Candidatus Rokuibacteriota bacterium]
MSPRHAPIGEAPIGWKLQREIVLLLAWGPAILLQLAHPLVARGVADHSAVLTGRRGRLRRLHHTVNAMLQLCFGTEQQARAALARINRIHDRVNGHLPEAAGIFPAGTGYSAHDPALLAWVHATLLDMNVRAYELYVAPLPPGETDRYCAEASAIEEPLGIPRGRLPRSSGELRQYMDAMLASGEIAVTDTARALALAVVYPPVPRIAAPALSFVRLATFGLLPPAIRKDYGFSWGPRHEAILRLSARLIRNVLPLTPSVVRHWPASRGACRAARRSAPVQRYP